MNEEKVYFLVRYDIGYFTCYARGISILNIQNLSEFCIVRFCGTRIKDSGTRLIQGSLIPEFYPLALQGFNTSYCDPSTTMAQEEAV